MSRFLSDSYCPPATPDNIVQQHTEQYQERVNGIVIDDIDREYARIQSEGVPITTAIETEPWGERFFQVTDPNGVVI
jgi:uncharacterized glyoxalase superfamily protein PhnB